MRGNKLWKTIPNQTGIICCIKQNTKQYVLLWTLNTFRETRGLVLTGGWAGLNLGGGSMWLCLLAAPWSVPARETERLEAQAQICDTWWAPGWLHLLGARHATTVGEEHPPAAHCSQLWLFSVQDPVHRCGKRKEVLDSKREPFQSALHRKEQRDRSHKTVSMKRNLKKIKYNFPHHISPYPGWRGS